MKKSGILIIAMIAAAGISSVSAADIDFDGTKGLEPQSVLGFINDSPYDGSCLAMICPTPEGMSDYEWDQCLCRPYSGVISSANPFFPTPVPQSPDNGMKPAAAPGVGAPFMNEQACSILDANFLVQLSREEASEMLRPCLADISTRYGAALKLAPGDKGLNLLVGDAKNPGKDLQAARRVHLKMKDNGQFFGHKVALYVPRAGASANKDGI